jgi:glycosyltransferase involved in cell wall biosynthesis
MTPPKVTIILPVLNEEAHIESTLDDLLGQDYEGEIELVVADGMSTDGTREILARRAEADRRVQLIDNRERRQAHGLNAAAAAATGEVLVRADGHTRYAPDYVSASVEALADLGGAVGGRMNPAGDGSFSSAVAVAMNSPLTMGPARFHHAEAREPVDTVYLGAFHRSDFEALGGLRSFPSGSSEDADFYYRWRRTGRPIHVDPRIRSWYVPRNRVGQLWRQYWRYGQGKSEMLWVNGRFPSWRPLAPMALVTGLISSMLIGSLGGWWWPLLALVAVWSAVLLIASLGAGPRAHLAMLAAAVMHLAYGLGGLWGLIRGPFPLRGLR